MCYIRVMPKTKSGFTIVELLIVIVVIGILAAITIVAYNGVQQRAKNGQTTQALAAWIKAFNLYKADNGRWPSGYSCLGEGYPYGPNATGSSGFQCRQSDATNGASESSTFQNTMRTYFNNSSLPTPAFVTAKSSDTVWRRGLTYLFGGGPGNIVYIEAALAGDVNPCPAAGGVVSTSRSVWGGDTYCYYQLGLTTDT